MGKQKQHIYINEDFVISQFYTNEDLYENVGKEMCIALYVALGRAGCKAVVKAFYRLVKHHMKNGRQLNASLIQCAVVDWCMKNRIKSITKLYIKGDPKYELKGYLRYTIIFCYKVAFDV